MFVGCRRLWPSLLPAGARLPLLDWGSVFVLIYNRLYYLYIFIY